jgi:hypothetical protein
MLAAVSSILPGAQRKHLVAQLSKDLHSAVSAEWEISVIYCLSKHGAVAVPQERERRATPDLIYTSRLGQKVVIEVTAVSDADLKKRNPVEEFSDWIRKISVSSGIHAYGGISYQIGHIEQNGRFVLGIPDRAHVRAFFASKEIRAFVDRIKSDPTARMSYVFEYRGSQSILTYVPGATTTGGGHIAHDVILDLERNSIVRRLEKKAKQIKDSGLDLPAVVILCDGDCRAMRTTMPGLGRPTVSQVVDIFLNGREHQAAGPWVLQSGIHAATKRINAVGLLSVHDDASTVWDVNRHRIVKGGYVLKTAEAYQVLDELTVIEIMDAFHHLPPVNNMPYNARHEYKMPALFGGWQILHGAKGMQVKLSLLTVQKLLSGEITYDCFAKAHGMLAEQIIKATKEGRMISAANVERLDHQDDDWIVFEFDTISPDALFKR